MRPVRPLVSRVLPLLLAAAVLGSTQMASAAEYEAQIVGGRVVTTEDWKSTVFVATDAFACTGTLIAPEWVLTAAHCIVDEATIYGGAIDPAAASWIEAGEGIAHPGYEEAGFIYDVGLYRLAAPHPAALPDVEVAQADEVDLWPVGSSTEVFGWGIDETGMPSSLLKTATLDVYDPRRCEAVVPEEFDESAMLCLFRPATSTCSGDSGGPVIRSSGSRRVIVGVTSWGPDTCDWFAVAAGRAALSWVHQTVFGTAPPASRLAGIDRFETAAAIADAGWSSADTVYVTTGRSFPDALAAGPAAAATGSPVLLVERDRIPAVTASALGRLGPSKIVVLGGTAAVTERVVEGLARIAGAEAVRVAGIDRYQTAIDAMQHAFPAGVERLYVATGRSFEDALMAGAAAAFQRGALLLVDPGAPVDPALVSAVRQLGPTRITAVGAVGSAVVAALSAVTTVDTVAGGDVAGRSTALWSQLRPGLTSVVLTTSGQFADGLAGASYAALRRAPLLVLPSTCVPASTAEAVRRLAPGELVLLGGTAALSPSVARFTACS